MKENEELNVATKLDTCFMVYIYNNYQFLNYVFLYFYVTFYNVNVKNILTNQVVNNKGRSQLMAA